MGGEGGGDASVSERQEIVPEIVGHLASASTRARMTIDDPFRARARASSPDLLDHAGEAEDHSRANSRFRGL